MNPLVPLSTGPAAPPTAPLAARIHDVLASANRLWLRGRLLGMPELHSHNGWFARWRSRKEVAFPTVAELETHIGGKVLKTQPVLGPHGDFEAMFTEELPAARRGWRVARNRLHVAGQTVEACAVVASPPPNA